jgi:hypothetical protein
LDWVQFFQQNNIPYVTSGPNVARGNVCTSCPYCGVEDTGQHMSINLAGKGFRCWRQPQHSGKNPAKLIQALLSCSWEQACSLSGQQTTLPNDFLNKLKLSLAGSQTEVLSKQPLQLPAEFKRFKAVPSCRPYINYLTNRNFSASDILNTLEYGVYYASQGSYKGRILFTIVQDLELVGWTGRTIYPNEQVRYKTLSHDIEKAKERDEIPALNPISHYLLFYDRLVHTDADTIVLCEGPFDAWKVNVLGESLGVVATCFFTSTLSKQQLNLLHEVLPKFKNRILLLDQKTFTKSARMKQDLVALDVSVKHLPKEIDDPGEIKNQKQLKECLQ